MKKDFTRAALIAMIVAALGYFVDVFDLILFSIVRVSSLKSLGLSDEAVFSDGIFLINCQMVGMLLGGILFGIWGDKRGRLQVLFVSILTYSLANIGNAFVHDIALYALFRFVAGVGLAGELGAGITLVSELLPKDKRGIGTTFVASIGVLGAVVASLVTKYVDWRWAYGLAGVLGLSLLILRIAVQESGLFSRLQDESHVERGSLKLLFQSRERLGRFIFSILPGLPIWFILGVLVTLAPEIGTAKNASEAITAGTAVFYVYLGFFLGDLLSGLFSQVLQSRKMVLRIFIVSCAVSSLCLLLWPDLTPRGYFLLYTVLGFFGGYWCVFITVAAEQFGTNLRATVATSVPNFIRGSVPPMTLALTFLRPHLGLIHAALLIIVVISVISLLSVNRLRESFHTDLDFYET